MEIMDPFAYELLARPQPPPGFDPFSCRGAANTEVTTEQLDDYFRAIGVLPPRPPADVAPTPGCTTPGATPWAAMDYAMELPATCELYAAAFDAQVQPVCAVPLPAPVAPASFSSATALKNSTAPYDADIDASLRAMEKNPNERPSPDYLDARLLFLWMYEFSEQHDLDAATLHRAVSYADRFLSARPLADDARGHRRLRLLGAAAVYAAAKFEDRRAAKQLDARKIAGSWQEVLETERALVAGLGYRLGGPTADTFVDHFTRHSQEEEENVEVQLMAHLIDDKSLFDHRCVKLLPSAVAAAAIFLARLDLKPSLDPEQVQRLGRELEEMTGYKLVSLKEDVDVMYSVMSNDY